MEAITATPPCPVRRPVMRQAWRDLTFLHWPFAPRVVRPLLPAGLELDLWEGAAWVGLVPFAIEDLTHPSMPAIPWLSHFLETNVRTYVVDRQGRRGVWFFSLDAARLAAVAGARAAYALPYFWSRMSLRRDAATVHYQSRRVARVPSGCDIAVEPGPLLDSAGGLDLFLTARFRLFAQRRGELRYAAIEHPPWPLQEARVLHWREDLLAAAGLPAPEGEPLARFSTRVQVLVGRPRV